MKLHVLISLVLCFFHVPDAGAQDSSPGSRVVPLPAAASEELRAAILAWPQRDISALPDPPVTNAEWTANIEQIDVARAAVVALMLEQYRVTVVNDNISDVSVHRITPADVSPPNAQRLFLYVHGGAYVYGKGRAGISEAIVIAHLVGLPVMSVDYRMPPEHPFPAAVDDVVKVYRELLKTRSANSIIIGGTSSGGGLALAAVHQFRNLDLPVPGAVYAGTPWADLTKTGDTLYTNEGLDQVMLTYDGLLSAAAILYAGTHDLRNPLISPVYGDFGGFPPTILTSGTRDLFLSDVARTHRKLREMGVPADLHVYEGMSHADYIFSPDLPESKNMYSEIEAFMDRHLD